MDSNVVCDRRSLGSNWLPYIRLTFGTKRRSLSDFTCSTRHFFPISHLHEQQPPSKAYPKIINMGVTKEQLTPGNGTDKPTKGDTITMEYTGNLFDEKAANKKGKQSVPRISISF